MSTNEHDAIFHKGDHVIISEDYHWAKLATGRITNGDRRILPALKGQMTFYYVQFDHGQYDADGDGPYGGGEIDVAYIKLYTDSTSDDPHSVAAGEQVVLQEEWTALIEPVTFGELKIEFLNPAALMLLDIRVGLQVDSFGGSLQGRVMLSEIVRLYNVLAYLDRKVGQLAEISFDMAVGDEDGWPVAGFLRMQFQLTVRADLALKIELCADNDCETSIKHRVARDQTAIRIWMEQVRQAILWYDFSFAG